MPPPRSFRTAKRRPPGWGAGWLSEATVPPCTAGKQGASRHAGGGTEALRGGAGAPWMGGADAAEGRGGGGASCAPALAASKSGGSSPGAGGGVSGRVALFPGFSAPTLASPFTLTLQNSHGRDPGSPRGKEPHRRPSQKPVLITPPTLW